MDFIIGFPRIVRQNYSIIVVERLTEVGHFILVKSTFSASDVAHVFIWDVVKLHGVLKNIVSNRDSKFTFMFWKELFAGLGIDLAFSIAYHPRTDRKGQ